ncbi:MAG TPA: hypothetical protein DCE47_05110 [Planctomycetaceae bacterium]|nr:hypothetical protein [Planctomycetaceae bacterium]HCD01693.1 hypothetical protein [Planctomycetaceae bacterium]|tara:strand:- start:233 stop:502 length:270 start_codon:yes stop_codon:yes gene_type:complete
MTTSDSSDWDFEGELAHLLLVTEVPPVPEELDTTVHLRLNRALLISHWITFLTAVIPLVLTTMINPIGHLLIQTFSGRPRRSTGSNEDS